MHMAFVPASRAVPLPGAVEQTIGLHVLRGHQRGWPIGEGRVARSRNSETNNANSGASRQTGLVAHPLQLSTRGELLALNGRSRHQLATSCGGMAGGGTPEAPRRRERRDKCLGDDFGKDAHMSFSSGRTRGK